MGPRVRNCHATPRLGGTVEIFDDSKDWLPQILLRYRVPPLVQPVLTTDLLEKLCRDIDALYQFLDDMKHVPQRDRYALVIILIAECDVRLFQNVTLLLCLDNLPGDCRLYERCYANLASLSAVRRFTES